MEVQQSHPHVRRRRDLDIFSMRLKTVCGLRLPGEVTGRGACKNGYRELEENRLARLRRLGVNE
jgi:hypothetical protein